MKIVMVNDCAFVGETLLKYLPPEFEKQHIKRGRGLWSKTFSLAYKILRAKGDVYHVNYLLQDCYIASRLGKRPLLGHGHGSDIRRSLHHPVWGRIVRHNLKRCDKVIVSTPDLLRVAQEYGRNVEYLPNPVDTEFFYPKPLDVHNGKLKVLIGSASDWAKGTDIAIRAIAKLRNEVDTYIVGYGKDLRKTLTLAESLGLKMQVLSQVPHKNMNEYYWNADIVIDQFKCGVFGLVTLEAIACGRPAITYVSSMYPEYENLPLKEVNSVEKVVETIKNIGDMTKVWKAQYTYFKENHDVASFVKKMLKIYEELNEGRST